MYACSGQVCVYWTGVSAYVCMVGVYDAHVCMVDRHV